MRFAGGLLKFWRNVLSLATFRGNWLDEADPEIGIEIDQEEREEIDEPVED